MKYLSSIFDFYISASLHVAISVVALTYITFLQIGLNFDLQLLTTIFCATVISYNFVKFAPLYYRKETYQKPKYILIALLSGICGFIFSINFLNSPLRV